MYPHWAVMPFTPAPLPEQEMEAQSEQAVTAAVEETLGATAAVTTSVLQGPPAGALLQAVTPDSVLVLGSRGRGGFAGLLLGSVSQECVEYASCPVVVVRNDRFLGDGDVILVGKDGSEGAKRALGWADALATATGAGLHAVYAWRATVSERPPRMGRRLETRAASAVQGWTGEIADAIDSEQVEGDPREVLVSAAERVGAAFTVVGRRGAGGLRSMRLGSTANHLVRHAPTNVAVVPAPVD
jgi:nucleotide-binding universal stress UspA family protein